MSNALAIAHVTQALALLIEDNLRPEIDMAVSVETRKPPADPPPDPTINVFLYQVTPNPSLRNNDLVTRASDGTLLKRAAAALDLHYVISAYGEETELVGQRLIGSVVRTLHEIPVLPRDVIEAVAQRPYLEGSDLADSPQRVRFTPQVMDVDETSKLWGMLYQTPYTLSVVYTATLVLIDGREQPVPARAVERSSVRVLPFGAPGAPVPPRAEDRPAQVAAQDGRGTDFGTDGSAGAGGSGAGGSGAGGSGADKGARGEGEERQDEERSASGTRAQARKSTEKLSEKAAKAAQPPARTASRTPKTPTRKTAAKKTTAAGPTAAKRTGGSGRPKGSTDGES
jgi:pyruvate/2-oxoglutarate dehydrogenase complex dihydrolipoamide acyltransferase (E2) component